jgi:sigma-B regulation protein RsbU (phosphoserine phosphatase)
VCEVQLQPGDCVLFFTDGLIEAKSEQGERYSYRRLLKLLDNFDVPDEAVLGEVNRDLYRFMGKAEPLDDITAVKLIVR